jgi:hypothetical protein
MTDDMVTASTGIGLGRWHSIVVQVVSRSGRIRIMSSYDQQILVQEASNET